MINSLKAKMKLIKHNLSRFITNARSSRHIIVKFADKLGLTYFGSVNQHTDDHKIIRGFTVSQSHKDANFCVGTVGEYDVMMVDRSDAVWNDDGSISIHNWIIMAIDLKTKQDLPHFFISAHNYKLEPYKSFFTTFPAIKEISLGTFEQYTPEFVSRFKLYSRPNMAVKTQNLIPSSVARVLSAHFWPLSAEQNENVLYIYSANQRISLGLLETMLENGLWLAAHLDRQSELV